MAEMEAVAMMACLAALTLLRKVESPALPVSCDPGEFSYSGICCKLCPAGTHVVESCTFPHTLGTCKSCIDGETYTDFDNPLDQCFSCINCKSDFKMIAPCTRKKNTECQCKDGYFCSPAVCEVCKKCKTRCPEGQMIMESCNATTDMKCGLPYTAPCIRKKNTECQCNDGYFCSPGCEECKKCKTRCPEGQVIMENCNATTDMKCGPPYPEASDSSFTILYIVVGVLVLVLAVIAYILYKRRKSSPVMNKVKEESTDHLIPDNNENINSTTEATAASQDRLPETVERENLEMGSREQDNVLPNRPPVSSSLEVACSNVQSSGTKDVQRSNKPAVRINTSCMKTLEEAYFQTKDMVGSNYWNIFMRKCGLSDNDIDGIKNDYAHDSSDEQRYRMLTTLRDRNGVVPAFHKIFASLQEMKLNGIYENLINELKSKDLIIKETED